MNWQPIDSAPMGEIVWLYADEFVTEATPTGVVQGEWDEISNSWKVDRWDAEIGDWATDHTNTPTHWASVLNPFAEKDQTVTYVLDKLYLEIAQFTHARNFRETLVYNSLTALIDIINSSKKPESIDKNYITDQLTKIAKILRS